MSIAITGIVPKVKPFLRVVAYGLSQCKTLPVLSWASVLSNKQPGKWDLALETAPSTHGTPCAIGMRMDNNINKATFSILAVFTLVAAAIMHKIRTTVEAQAPEGYEDENGFHFGSPDLKS